MMPIGFGPLEGTAVMELGGFVLAESLATDNADKVLFGTRAAEIFAPYQKVPHQRNAMNPWFQLFLDQKERSR